MQATAQRNDHPASPRPALDLEARIVGNASRPAAEAAGAADAADGTVNTDTIMRIPVNVQVVLGRATMPVARLMKLGRGAVIPLDHRVGEPVDVVVNGRLVARGEIVVLEEDNSRLGITLTEIAGPGAAAPAR